MNYKVLKIEDILVSVSETKKITSKKIIFLNTSDIEKGKIIKQDYMEVSKLPGQAKKVLRMAIFCIAKSVLRMVDIV